MPSINSPVVTAREMRALEACAIARGTPATVLMETAGLAAARAIVAFVGGLPTLVLCGPGNNGGDGYVVARLLRDWGWPVRVAVLAPPAAAEAIAAAALWSGPLEALDGHTAPAPLLVDALFGIGLTRGVAADVATNLHRLAARARTVVAIDLPSGVSTDDGKCLSEPGRADLTVTFGALKPAHLLHPAAGYCGRLVVAGIGLKPEISRTCAVTRPVLPPLALDAHKFTRGHVLIAGGPKGSAGAARLSALAAQRAGAGYVTLVSPADAFDSNAAQLGSVVLALADAPAELASAAANARVSSLVVGPGFDPSRGRDPVLALFRSAKPIVLDADVFTLFAGDAAGLAAAICGPAVLTPHLGEFRRLFGDLSGSKVDQVRSAARTVGAVVLLKGPDTVIAAPDGRAAVCGHGTPYLATAGSGDVLTGVIAALLARGLSAFDAACAGAWLHAECGRRAGSGLIAEDLIDQLAAVATDCR